MALTKVSTPGIKDEAITLAKLLHGDSNNNGKFLRANNGADPTFETVNTDLVSDTSPQLGGDLASNGNDILLADNDSIKLGASNDFTMFHDSSGHTFLQDQGNGALRIRSDSEVAIQKWDGSTNENMAKFVPDGAVELYHDSLKKLETASNGVTITGVLDVNGSGTQFNGGTGNNAATDAVVYIDKDDNNDWCLKLKPNNGNSSNYGLVIEAENATGQAFSIRNSDDGNNNQFHINGEGDSFVGNIYPRTDANKDLGFRSGYRWRDLILSGGIQLGGTGTANYLDDYEEGSWTPAYASGVTNAGTYRFTAGAYVKVGRLVTLTGRIQMQNSNAQYAHLKIVNLPFTSSSTAYIEGNATWGYTQAIQRNNSSGAVTGHIPQSGSQINFYDPSGYVLYANNGNFVDLNGTIHFSAMYYTDA